VEEHSEVQSEQCSLKNRSDEPEFLTYRCGTIEEVNFQNIISTLRGTIKGADSPSGFI
jgi:hypothetical protein